LTLVPGTAAATDRYTAAAAARLDQIDAGEEALALGAAVKITAFLVRLPAGA
jgi:hypothetical protein